MELRDYQKEVIEKVHQSWKRGNLRPCIVIPCGGGKSVIAADMAKKATERGKRVLFLVHRQELCQQIEDTFSRYGVDMARCQVGMVQTVTRRLKTIPPPDFIITDENHHCLAQGYRRIYEAFPDVHCVGVTATPVRLNGGGLGDVNDDLILGPTVKELIARNCLAPFDYYAPQVADLKGLRSKAGDFDADKAAQLLDKPKIYGDIVRHYRELAGGKKAVCYCPTVRYSQTVAEEFCAAGIRVRHIDGNTPKAERQAAIDGFRRGEISVLCNVDLISEGFDVPDCGAAILLRPTKSLTLYIQQAMRCMRYQPGKRAIIIDHVGNVFRHGLPDIDREWKLDAKKETKREAAVKQCPACFYTYFPNGKHTCPKCGYQKPAQDGKGRRTPEEEKEIRLRRITERVRAYRSPEECSSVSELMAYAKKMGYKPGWGYYQAKQRGLL